MSKPEAAVLVDLDACAAEPIRVPGAIQPHGALAILDPTAETVLHVSANWDEIVGATLAPGDKVADVAGLDRLAPDLAALTPSDPPLLRSVTLGARPLQLAAHIAPQGVFVELEPPPASEAQTLEALYPRIRRFIDDIAAARTVREIAGAAVDEVRALTGFNRILLYSFDAKGDGTVLAESTDGVLPSYLNLRFPAFDIPPQARELYKLSRIRLIPNADYTPAPLIPPISPIDGQPIDLGRAALRSVSPIHLEYMRNMGTGSSMSISIIVEGELWGLVSGHSREPRQVNAQVRSACDHLGQVLSLQIEAQEQARRSKETLRLTHIQNELLAKAAAATDYAAALQDQPDTWSAVGGGAGAAIVVGDEVIAAGLTPPPETILEIAARLGDEKRTEAAIESLAELWPDAEEYADIASGLLAVSISQIHPNYLMWFRPEAVRVVHWAGEPQKPEEVGERLHPRKSFELWKEQVRLRSLPWSAEEIDSARRFRGAIQNFVLRRAEERAELTGRLEAINEELESFSYSISHDLRAPFRHVVGYAELLSERAGDGLDATGRRYLENIKDSALMAGRLVDDLLNFSQLGRNSLKPGRVDMSRLVQEVRRDLERRRSPKPEWRIGELPDAFGDPAMLRQVLHNLLQNALKYSATRAQPVIEISGEDLPDATRYTIRDNGVGFDMAYAHKLFSVFERLHRADEFEGTGIGLALVRRIIERHGGAVEGRGEPDAGASFAFTLPKAAPEAPIGDTPLG